MTARAVVLAAALAVSLAPGKARAHELERSAPLALGRNLGLGAAVTIVTLAVPAPRACSWCEPPAFDRALHAPWAADARRTAAMGSHFLSYVAIPSGALAVTALPPALRGNARHVYENAAILLECLLFETALTTAVKKVVARRRPAFHYGRAGDTEYGASPEQENVSFFSGDTAAAFALSSGAATLSFLRGYAIAPYVTAAGAVLSIGTGVLRVGADVHWPSDVLVGAAVGASIGIAVPFLLHPRTEPGIGRAVGTGHILPWIGAGGAGLAYVGAI